MSGTHGTTVLSVRRGAEAAIGGDGQVTLDHTIVKHTALKIRELHHGRVLVGFAGATADALHLLEIFDTKLGECDGRVSKAAIELARAWRTDRTLRHLEAILNVISREESLLITGRGDVIAPDDGVIGIGSGGSYAVAAARALVAHTGLSAAAIVRTALEIAAGLCVYTNRNIEVRELV
ncbi:MAG: ATP-dependent protease subunit HslV [Planctomycetota bacterium]